MHFFRLLNQHGGVLNGGLAVLAVVLSLGLASNASAVLIGGGATGANSYPFGFVGSDASTRYQQIYSSAEFAGPITINEIRFFRHDDFPGGNLNNGDYTLSLSTVADAVGSVNTPNTFYALGGDNQLFSDTSLIGQAAPAVLSFTGNPFAYDPSQGNLLLDIQIAGISPGAEPAFYDAHNSGDAGNIFGRAHNFDIIGQAGWGLVTEFVGRTPPTNNNAVPEPITATLGLMGLGVLGMATRRRVA